MHHVVNAIVIWHSVGVGCYTALRTMPAAAKLFSVLIAFSTIARTIQTSSRNERLWPLSASSTVDLGQSSPFGPRLMASQSFRYDFHRGVDIPAPLGTPVYAIDDGVVRIAGVHPDYSDPVVQVTHTNWDESPTDNFYANYLHMLNWSVVATEQVSKGQLLGHIGASASGFAHLHFEIRAGGVFRRYCCNPWKYLPNSDHDYSSFTVNVSLTPNFNGVACQAVVNVSVPPDQLSLNRIELLIATGGTNSQRDYDFCEDNLTHSFEEMDNPLFEGNLYVSPGRFSSRSYSRDEWATYGFEFLDLPEATGNATISAKVFDVFGNVISTPELAYVCTVPQNCSETISSSNCTESNEPNEPGTNTSSNSTESGGTESGGTVAESGGTVTESGGTVTESGGTVTESGGTVAESGGTVAGSGGFAAAIIIVVCVVVSFISTHTICM